MEGIDNILVSTEEQTIELENKVMEITQTEQKKRRKYIFLNNDSLTSSILTFAW